MLPPGKENVGEVCIIGPQVMKGYWKKPEETEQVLFRHPSSNWMGLRTGDMGYMDDDGCVYLVDRTKDLILLVGLQRLSAHGRGGDLRASRGRRGAS